MKGLFWGFVIFCCVFNGVNAQEKKEFVRARRTIKRDTLLFDFKNEDVLRAKKAIPVQAQFDVNYLPNTKVNMGRINRLGKSCVTPAILAGLGLYSGHANRTQDWLGKRTIHENLQGELEGFRSYVDDYLQWGPIAMCYGLKAFGVKGANSAWTSTKLLLKAELLTAAIVSTLKYTTRNYRPDGRKDNSFPSGHTSQAFVAATFLHREYGHLSKWYSFSGYAMATTVGCMRMMNRRHWFNDVAVGAALGMGLTNLVYWQHDRRNDKKKRKWTAIPSVSDEHATVSMLVQF